MSEMIFIEGDENAFDFFVNLSDKHRRLVIDVLDDIADRVEREAQDNAPVGDTGELREHATERREFSRRFRVDGDLVYRTEISVPDRPKKARWVHDGTGLYGPLHRWITPRTAPFMVFQINGRHFKLTHVRGQQPQPYLRDAVDEVEATYIPIKLAELRARLELND